MKIMFVHQNCPGQYKHLARIFAADARNEVVALTMAPPVDIPGVRVIQHAWNRAQTIPHAFLSDLDVQVQRGQSAAHTAQQLRSEGFSPDLICAHPGWGEAMFLKDVFPQAKLVCFQEFFYRSTGSDINFDPEFNTSDQNQIFQLRTRNANILIGLDAADQNISPTHWQKSQFSEKYLPNISVVHDGIDTSVVRPDDNAWVELAQMGRRFTRKDRVVTFINRNFEPYRGFNSFMRAIPLILDACPDAKIICVGGDEVSYGPRLPEGMCWRDHYMQALAGRIPAESVRFVGKIPYAYYLNLLQISSCHVYLTYPFVLSWSMLEAMSVGAVVVGSATQPVEEVITHGGNGYLVDFFSPEAIARQVVEVLETRDDQELISRNARQTIVDRYDLQRVCLPEHVRIYQELTGMDLPFEASSI